MDEGMEMDTEDEEMIFNLCYSVGYHNGAPSIHPSVHFYSISPSSSVLMLTKLGDFCQDLFKVTTYSSKFSAEPL